MTNSWYRLPTPAGWPAVDRCDFLSLARSIECGGNGSSALSARLSNEAFRRDKPGLCAASGILIDLAHQGWNVRIDSSENIEVQAPEILRDATDEKGRVRGQELLKRNEQLSTASVRRFVRAMERPREFHGTIVSIFDLMRDGAELADALRATARRDDPTSYEQVINPYIEVVSERAACRYTGLRLIDIWRYFRHTWSNQYSSTPGRTMQILIRDRAAPFHPVIGIAALGSPIIQIAERDEAIGWQPPQILASLSSNPTAETASWLKKRLEGSLRELYLDDLIEDGLYWPDLWRSTNADAVTRLKEEAVACRRGHQRFGRRRDFAKMTAKDSSDWVRRARTDLYRSKRCALLAEILQWRQALLPYLAPRPSAEGLRRALLDPRATAAMSGILRRAKAEAVGTEMADLTVCGAVAPYADLLGGKLISMLAVSPSVVRAYHQRYRNYESEIASAMAGRPIRRRSHLVFVGTTSLYGSGSSQYNRVRIPAAVLKASADISFVALGRSRSFGTSHLSETTVQDLARMAEQTHAGVRVNSIFGEGVNPKFRKVRAGLDLLGWPSDALLRHRRERIVYGIRLADNVLPYLLGIDRSPRYLASQILRTDVARINHWWVERWLIPRLSSADVVGRVRQHTLTRPVRHGARVALPQVPDEELEPLPELESF